MCCGRIFETSQSHEWWIPPNIKNSKKKFYKAMNDKYYFGLFQFYNILCHENFFSHPHFPFHPWFPFMPIKPCLFWKIRKTFTDFFGFFEK
jgi:hypothetical protein